MILNFTGENYPQKIIKLNETYIDNVKEIKLISNNLELGKKK